jgi:hypothetical protein
VGRAASSHGITNYTTQARVILLSLLRRVRKAAVLNHICFLMAC